jgi:hypothetical protein
MPDHETIVEWMKRWYKRDSLFDITDDYRAHLLACDALDYFDLWEDDRSVLLPKMQKAALSIVLAAKPCADKEDS